MKIKSLYMILLILCLTLMGCQKTEEVKETEVVSQETVEEDNYEKIARENFLLKEELKSLQDEVMFYREYAMRESVIEFMEWSDGPKAPKRGEGAEYSEENVPYAVSFPEPFDESKVEVVLESVEEGEKESLILQMEEENESLRTSIEELTIQAESYRKMYGVGDDNIWFGKPAVTETQGE